MIDLLTGRPAQLLAETLLHFLWQGAALALLLKFSDPLLRSVQDRYSASLGTLVVMLLLPLGTCYVLVQRELAPLTSTQQVVVSTEALVADPPGLAAPAILSRWQPLFVGVWLVGVLLLAARLLVGYAATLWLRGDRRPLSASLAHKVAWLGQRLGVATHCRVFLSSRINEAIAVGCFKPLVLIPLAWATELPPSALEAVIAHELAHIRRWDLWATLLQRLAETLLFYHPAVWWLSRRLSQQRELCCDALAVSATRAPADYVLALETIARRTSAPPLTLATSFLGGGNMNLLDRVRHVLKGGSRETSAWWPAGLAALFAPLLAAAALGGWSLLPATVVADDDDNEPAEARVEEGPTEASEYLELVVRLLEAADEDGADEDESEEAARNGKIEAAREREAERELRDAQEALAREAKKLKKFEEEVIVRKRNPNKKSGDEFDLSDFRPETDREERLLAVIKKLQAQIKGAGAAERIKKGSGASKKPAAPESKDPEALYEYKILRGEKLKQDDEYRRILSDKEAILARQREAKERDAKRRKDGDDAAVKQPKYIEIDVYPPKEQEAHEEALDEKDALLRKQKLADAIAEKDLYSKKLLEKEAINEKEAILRKQKHAEAIAEKEAYQKKLAEKEAILRKAKDADAAAEKEAWFRKLKREGKQPDDEVESLRRALKEREAELQKLHEALKRIQKDVPGKKDPDRKDEERTDKDGQSSLEGKSFDDYVRARVGEGLQIRVPDDEEAAEGDHNFFDLWRIFAGEPN